MTASVREKGNESLLLKKQGAPIQMTGAIQDYKLSIKSAGADDIGPGASEEFGVLVKDAKVTMPDKK